MTEYYEPAKVTPGDPDDPESAALAEWAAQQAPPVPEGSVHTQEHRVVTVRCVVTDPDGIPIGVVSREVPMVTGRIRSQ